MTVPSQNPVIEHVGNGVTVAFPYDFLCFAKSDLAILADLVVVDPASYTVSGLGVPTGGTVTFNTAPAAGVKITIRLQVVLERLTDYQTAGDLLAAVLNRDLDRVWLALQGNAVDITGALKFPPGEDASFIPPLDERKGRVLVFDPVTGAPTVSQDDWIDQAAAAAASAAASAASAQDSQTSANNSNSSAELSQLWATKIGSTVDGVDYSSKSNALLSKDWATKTSGTVDGVEYSAKYWAQQSLAGAGLPKFNAGSEPTTNAGDIWINGVGACRWDAGDARYWLIPTYTNFILVTASGTVARPGTYVKYGQWDGCAGGGSGGRGSTPGTGRSSGGGAGASISREPFVFSSTPLAVTIGAGGAGPSGASSPVAGNDGGATVFSGITLSGGKAGAASNSVNVEGGAGGTSASPRTVAGMPGEYANSVSLTGDGGAPAFGFGLGGRNGRPNTGGTADPSGYGAGSGGVAGSNSNPAAPGFIRIWY